MEEVSKPEGNLAVHPPRPCAPGLMHFGPSAEQQGGAGVCVAPWADCIMGHTCILFCIQTVTVSLFSLSNLKILTIY